MPPLPSADAPASVAQRAYYQKKNRKMNRKWRRVGEECEGMLEQGVEKIQSTKTSAACSQQGA